MAVLLMHASTASPTAVLAAPIDSPGSVCNTNTLHVRADIHRLLQVCELPVENDNQDMSTCGVFALDIAWKPDKVVHSGWLFLREDDSTTGSIVRRTVLLAIV